jgi:pyruvate dehydrogenase E2 component (dihydrolipoamide acetyltransferase)
MEMRADWSAIERVREQLKADRHAPHASQFLLFAWCVAQAARNHPRFRSAMLADSTIREYNALHLGIAVAREGDELVMARVPNADGLSFRQFVEIARSSIERARHGVDQAADPMQLSLTNMASQGVRFGIPVIAAPAVGTLFVGEAFDEAYPLKDGGIGFRRMVTLVLSFDHRIANGVGAANFLGEVRSRMERLTLPE